MKKNKLFGLLQDFVYGLEPQGQEFENQLTKVGIDIDELWGDVDSLLMYIAGKFGEDN